METRERSRDFFKGGVTPGVHQILVSTSTLCFTRCHKERLTMGEGCHEHPGPPGHTLETKLPIPKLLQKMNIKRVSSFTWACRLCSSPFSICLTRPSLRSHQIVTDITAETDDRPILVIGGILLSICRSTRVTTGSLFEFLM